MQARGETLQQELYHRPAIAQAEAALRAASSDLNLFAIMGRCHAYLKSPKF